MRPPDRSLNVLLHDGPCLVVNKPSGVLTQAPPGIDSLEQRVRQFFRRQESKPDSARIYTGVPHRLDRPVSGAIVFGRHVRATRRLADQFQARSVDKVYWAVVEAPRGDLPHSATWHDHLRKIPGRAFTEVVDATHPAGKPAVLHLHCQQQQEGIALIAIRLETGRTHQIRVQLASRGFHVLGDEQYGATVPFGPDCTADPRQRAIALHARVLKFEHPMTHQPVRVVAPLPSTWESLGKSFRFSLDDRLD